MEAIRRQNFQERKEIQRQMAGVRAPVAPSAQVLRPLHHLWGFLYFLFHGNSLVGHNTLVIDFFKPYEA